MYHTLPSCSVTDRPGFVRCIRGPIILGRLAWSDLDADHGDDDVVAVVRT